MTVDERILRIPRVGVEHEYRWQVPNEAVADAAASDELRARVVRAAGLPVADQTAILQHTLCFDTAGWDLLAAGCSMTALVNTGRPPGPSWLVAKETIHWVAGRRDVVELTEYVPNLKKLSQKEMLGLRPALHLARRVPDLGRVDVFAHLAQHRTKAALRAGDTEIFAVSCDAVELRDRASRRIGSFALVELEANQATRVGLDVLGTVAEKVSALLGAEPIETTKPQLAADRLGRSGAAW